MHRCENRHMDRYGLTHGGRLRLENVINNAS
jgi:hypothetical protein